MDVKGPTVLQMIKHMRSAENQAEFSHNSDYAPETLGKVRESLGWPITKLVQQDADGA